MGNNHTVKQNAHQISAQISADHSAGSTLNTLNTSNKSTSNMYRRDTKTKWTEQQLLHYRLELKKELERQTNLENDQSNTNIFSCCMTSKKKKKKKKKMK